MDMAKMEKRLLLAVFSGLLLFISPPKAVADDAELREKALALNDITGDDTIEGEIKALVKDKADTKKLLAIAAQMAKEKDQPFNYTGAFILARAAHLLKNLEAGQVLYRVCGDQAFKLRSTEKMAQAFGGLIDLLYEHKKYDEGVKVCQELLEKKDDEGVTHGIKLAVLRLLIQGKAKQGKTDEALKMVDNLVRSQPGSWRALELKGSIQHEAGKFEDAANTWVDALAGIQKDEDLDKEVKSEFVQQLQFKLGNLYVDLNQAEKATEHFKPLLVKDADSPGIKNRLSYLLVLRQMIREKAKQGKTAMVTKVMDNLARALPDNWLALDLKGWVQHEAGKYGDAAKTWEDGLDGIQKDEDLDKEVKNELAQELQFKLGNLYVDLNQVEKAVEHFKPLLAEDAGSAGIKTRLGYMLALQQMVHAKAKQGKTESVVKAMNNLAQLLPDNWPALALKGMAEYEAGENAQAAKTWEDVLDRLQKDPSLDKEKEIKSDFVKQFHQQLSGVYVDANQIDKSIEHLQAVLADDPDDPGANNDLGYIWADHDMNLDEAEKMIRKALDEDSKRRKKEKPDLEPVEDKANAAYLDSLGWVLYKKKKYQEAKVPLLKAVAAEDGKHIEIYDHLGDIHMALGEKAEAIAVWKKALELKLEQKREKEIKTKVEKKLKEATSDK